MALTKIGAGLFKDTLKSSVSGALGDNATTIRNLTSAGITGSFSPASASISTRLTTAESELSNTLISSSVLSSPSQGTIRLATNGVNTDVDSGLQTSDSVQFSSVQADGGVTVDNITIDGTEIDLSSGDLTVDVAGDIVLDADGADVILKDDGTEFGRFKRDSSDFVIKSATNNKDIIFKGQDGGATITALTLDMSESGNAIFNNDVTIAGTLTAQEIHTEFTSASIMFSSGSTKFGDTIDDTHEVTGSMTISGSVTVNDGTLTVTDNVDFNGDLDVDGTTNLDVVDIDGAVDMASTLAVGGNITLSKTADNTSAKLQVQGDFNNTTIRGASGNAGGLIVLRNSDTTDNNFSAINFQDGNENTLSGILGINKSHSSNQGEIAFFVRGDLHSDGDEAMRITHGGDVGIGTTSPGNNSILHVSASATGGSDSDVVISNTKTTAQFHRGLLVLHPNISNTHSGMVMFGNAESSGNSGHISFVNNASDGSESVRIGIFAKDDLVTVTGAGNVGIGQTSPADKLDVTNGNVRVRVGGAGAIHLQNDGSNHSEILANDNGGTTTVQLKTSGVSFLNGGDVGIGVSPSVKLHVKEDNSSDDAQIKVENDGTGDAGIAFLLTGTRGYSMGIDNSDGDKFIIGGDDNAIGTTPYLTIDHSNKNVGIDTTSPSRDFVISNGGAGGIEFGAGDTNSVISLFNRSNSSYTNIDIEAATIDFLTGSGADKQVSINSSGQLSVGTQTASGKLHVQDATHRACFFVSKTTAVSGDGAAATTIGSISIGHDATGDGAGVMFDGVVNVRCATSSGHTSIRTIRLQMLVNRSGTNGASTNTSISATILTTTDGTSNTAFSETGSAGTVNSITFSTLISGASQTSGTCQIRATTNTDSGSATSIDLVGFIYGRGDISFS